MLNFAGVNLPSYVKVNSISYSILPPIQSKTEEITGRAGAYDFGIELGSRKIDVDIQIIADNETDVIKKARSLATWLYHKDLQPLIISDEPDKMYMARLTDESEVTELYRTGTASLSFLCPNAFAESVKETVKTVTPPDATTPIQITNNGSVETYPVIDLTMTKDSEVISVVSDESYVTIGDANGNKTPTKLKSLVLSDGMTSYTGWTTALAVDEGKISGTFYSTGESVRQTSGTYGNSKDKAEWSGASAIKSMSREVQDFNVEARFGFKESSPMQMGRVELYLLDINNIQIGKISLFDLNRTMIYPRFMGVAGRAVDSHTIWKGVHPTKKYQKKIGTHNLPMTVKISRKGNVWSVFQSEHYENGKIYGGYTKKWTDTKKKYTSKLAKIQIHIGAYGAFDPVSTMYISDLKVYDIGSLKNDSVSDIIFETGDVVTIDNQRAVVLKNGEPVFTDLDPSSSFFSLSPGANGIIVTPKVADMTISYRERWL